MNAILRKALIVSVAVMLPAILSSVTCSAQNELGDYEKNLYYVEYQFMPVYLRVNYEEHFPAETYSSLKPMAEGFREDGYDDIGDILDKIPEADIFLTENKDTVMVFTFPEPTSMPLAKYGAAVIPSAEDGSIRYFTLEKTIMSDDVWIVGEPSESSHSSIGASNSCDSPEAFFKVVTKYIGSDEILGKTVYKKGNQSPDSQ